jgi:hypothetical protein
VVLFLGTSLGCDAIPINLPDPSLSDGGVVSDGPNRSGGKDSGTRGDSLKPPGGPDLGYSPALDALRADDAEGSVDGAPLPWLPDACIGDASGDAICPAPPVGDGGLDDGGLVDGGLDGGGAVSDGGPEPGFDGATTNPDASP